tara:strand:- start:978 stop:1442 length:465 start_codon:yes stop_codon:yes gene_type:complete
LVQNNILEFTAKKNFNVSADINLVWDILNKPEKVVFCVPGAELTEVIDKNNFKGKVIIKIGPVTARFNGKVTFTRRDSEKYEFTMEGHGSDLSGKGGVTMRMSICLKAIEKSTLVESNMSISITGRIAQFGSRMIDAVSSKLFDQFTKNFSKLI